MNECNRARNSLQSESAGSGAMKANWVSISGVQGLGNLVLGLLRWWRSDACPFVCAMLVWNL